MNDDQNILNYSSHLAATADILWKHALCMTSVNTELHPLIKMTFPKNQNYVNIKKDQLGTVIFKSIILLFGIIPIDIYEVTFIEFEEGKYFQECSPTLTQRCWKHRREIIPVPEGCIIRDRVELEPRNKLWRPIYYWFAKKIFNTRHKNLQRLFGYEMSLKQTYSGTIKVL